MLDFLDCNVVVGKIKTPMPGGILDAERLLAEMDRYGIREALVYHALAKRNAPERGNALAAEAASRSERLHPCWFLLPPGTDETPPLEQLAAAMQASRVRAVRMAPDAGNHTFSLSKVVCGELLGWLAAAHVPLFLEQQCVSWVDIDNILETYSGLPLVLTDASYRINRDLYPRLKACEDLYVETSGLEQHCELQDMCERFGAGRLLFGSRMPYLCAGAARHAPF